MPLHKFCTSCKLTYPADIANCNNIKRNYTAKDLVTVASWMDAWGSQVEPAEALG